MSASVWFEQIDMALIKYVQERVQINGMPVRCRVRKPDEDFKKEDYPLVSIYNLYSKLDTFRKAAGPVIVNRNTDTGRITFENPAIPYNLFYQIDFWAMQQSQMNSMMMQWITALNGEKYFNLPVIDNGGVERSSFCLRTEDFKKSDVLLGTSRIFHSFITYRIYVEIDENVQSEESLVRQIDVKTNKEV